MRDIKFRAWRETEKHMYNWNNLLNQNLKNIFTITKSCGYNLMQYTGLKDKNGKEIYEGDIIKICAEGLGGEAIGKIVYDEYDLAFELRNEAEELSECLWYENQQIEVIGNIYDNLELLEEKE